MSKKCIVCGRTHDEKWFSCPECSKEAAARRKYDRWGKKAYIQNVQENGKCAICGKSTDSVLYFLSTKPVDKMGGKATESLAVVHLDCLIKVQPKAIKQ